MPEPSVSKSHLVLLALLAAPAVHGCEEGSGPRGECLPGDSNVIACGLCGRGTGTIHCDEDGTWPTTAPACLDPDDHDGDGYSVTACGDAPVDCNDDDPAIHPADIECTAGDSGACTSSCDSAGSRSCSADCRWSACEPPSEMCNGLDDDCDGETDDGFPCVAGGPTPCTTTCGTIGEGRCTGTCASPGAASCTPPGDACNGLDDNCDGDPDDGFPCVAGGLTPCLTTCGTTGEGRCTSACAIADPASCSPPLEACNGLDDDCDGETDEDRECIPGTIVPCRTECGTAGTGACSATCLPPEPAACVPPPEACDGIDDDCDGETDETFPCVSGSVAACTTTCGSSGTGTCASGCAPAAPADCTAPVETCNGRDDDCDGETDEGFDCHAGATESCTAPDGSTGERSCGTACIWSACDSGYRELCNGLDDDGNGRVDDGIWCWSLPVTGNETFRGAAAGAGGRLWVVSEGGSVFWRDASGWSSLPTGAGDRFDHVFAFPSGEAWVTGRGGIVHFDGTRWRDVDHAPGGWAYAAWGAAPDDVWFSGVDNVMHWDGTSLSVVDFGATTYEMLSIWGFATDDVWVGSNPMYHWDGTSWNAVTAPAGATVADIWGAAPNDIWATASRARTVLHWDGTAWSSMAVPLAAGVWAFRGTATDDVWLAGTDGVTDHWDGTRWTAVPTGTTNDWYGLAAFARDDVWVFGEGGAMMHWDGTSWAYPEGMPYADIFNDIRGTGADDVWAVGGYGGHVRRWDGTAWSARIPAPTTTRLQAVSPRTRDDVWFAGESNTLLHWDGTAITASAPPAGLFSSTVWTDIWTISATDAIATIDIDNPARWDGSTWSMMTGARGGAALWASGPDDIWVVGGDSVRRWNGSTWEDPGSSTVGGLDIWGCGGGIVYTAVLTPALQRWDGASWTRVDLTSASFADMATVWCASPGEIWAGGRLGRIVHGDGTTFRLEPTGTRRFIWQVWGPGTGDVWAVTGAILRRRP